MILNSKINKLGQCSFCFQGCSNYPSRSRMGPFSDNYITSVNDINVGKMDRNPYNKDNSTNWVNWNELPVNIELVNFYKKFN